MAVSTKNKKTELILESSTLWDFPTQNYGNKPHGDNKFNGVTPAFVIWNLLQRYTKQDDLVVDPMAGSGTTIDVAKELGRQVIGYDIAPYRKDIIQNDARKIPLKNNSVDFVFIDSPYSDNVKYSDHPECIGKISCTDNKFFDELEKVAREIHRILKSDKYMAWLIGDHWRKNTGYIPVGFKVYNMLNKYFKPVDVISVVRRNQTSNTSVWHKRAREFNFYLRGFKFLFIMQKTNQEEL